MYYVYKKPSPVCEAEDLGGACCDCYGEKQSQILICWLRKIMHKIFQWLSNLKAEKIKMSDFKDFYQQVF